MVQVAHRIACLPVAGPDNPYQQLMMAGLSQSGKLQAFSGVNDKFLGILRTILAYKPAYIHFDWIASYYFRRWRWLTWLSVPLFCGQVLMARLLGVKLVWTLHNILPHDSGSRGIHSFCQRFLARRCSWIRVFAHSTVPKAAAELRLPETQFRVVPEGDYTTVYPDNVSTLEARLHLKIPPNARVLLYLGFIKPYKGILELVQLFNNLADATPAYLLIAGKSKDATYTAQISDFLTEKIVFVDSFIDSDVLQYYYKASDVVVLPFKDIENSGSVIMAMGFSKPIIAPALGVLNERLSQQKQLLYSDPAGLSSLVSSFIKGTLLTSECARLGQENRQALRFRWEDFENLFV